VFFNNSEGKVIGEGEGEEEGNEFINLFENSEMSIISSKSGKSK
jgi:hypothetical protein